MNKVQALEAKSGMLNILKDCYDYPQDVLESYLLDFFYDKSDAGTFDTYENRASYYFTEFNELELASEQAMMIMGEL